MNSSTQKASPFTFRAHRVSSRHLAKLEADPSLEAFGFEMLKEDAPVSLASKTPTCLRILADRSVDGKGGQGKWATFVLARDEVAGVALRALGHDAEPAYLTVIGDDFAAARSSDDPAARWFFQPVHVSCPYDNFSLTRDQYAAFAKDGFVILRQVVPEPLVDDALAFINNFVGQGPSAWVLDTDAVTEPNDEPKMKLRSSSHPSIMQLVSQTCISAAAEQLLGSGRVMAPGSGQLAVRFPVVDRLEKVNGELTEASLQVVHRDYSRDHFHIDGTGKESPLPFSLLCKVALSDQTGLHRGNFTIFPGSHRRPEVIDWHFSQIRKSRVNEHKRPDAGEPLQVRLAVGDAVMVHPYLCHRIGTNTSPHVRYSVIFRFRTREFLTNISRPELLRQNPMLEFDWFAHDGDYNADDQGREEDKTKRQKIA